MNIIEFTCLVYKIFLIHFQLHEPVKVNWEQQFNIFSNVAQQARILFEGNIILHENLE